MIKEERCSGCGRQIYTETMAGLTFRTDPSPLDGPGALSALLGGVTLYRVTFLAGRPAHHGAASPAVLEALHRFGSGTGEQLLVVAAHRCPPSARGSAPVWRPKSTPGGAQEPPTPPSAPVAPSRPFSGPSGATPPPSSVSAAETHPSDQRVSPRVSGPRCDACSRPCADGTYASVEIGSLVVWAQHVTECPAA